MFTFIVTVFPFTNRPIPPIASSDDSNFCRTKVGSYDSQRWIDTGRLCALFASLGVCAGGGASSARRIVRQPPEAIRQTRPALRASISRRDQPERRINRCWAQNAE